MPGRLFVVSTPIGNLEDITLRALRVLREAALIAAEDTRRTANLLKHYHIVTPTTSLHAHNEREKSARLLTQLEAGEDVALVTDAGTPTISDPGARFVAAARGRGIRVEPIPGPSAVMAALAASGFPADTFSFLGFPPARSKAREAWLQAMAADPRTLVFFEAPHRVFETLHLASDVLVDRPIAVARELTKQFEELVVGPIHSVLEALGPARGEYTVVVSPKPTSPAAAESLPTPEQLLAEFSQMTEKEPSLGRRGAISRLAGRYGRPAREVYALIVAARQEVE